MERVCIFIDGSNFYYQLKEYKPELKIDYYELSKVLTGPERKLIRTYYYLCPPADHEQQASYHDQQRFISYLQNTPYFQLQFGSLEKRGETQVEKGVDVRLAVDMVSLAYTNVYDVCVLVSNDADLAPAIEQVKSLGKHVEYIYVTKKTVQLVESCDFVRAIDESLFKKIRI